jgi:transposase InsO family protein
MCRVLEVSRSSYYKWRSNYLSQRMQKRKQLDEVIKVVYFWAKQRYGSPRIAKELAQRGFPVSRNTVARHMKMIGIRSKLSRKFKVTTDSNHTYKVPANLLNREFTVNAPSVVWISDITYIHTIEGFLYLTMILDLFDRKIIGWSISNGMGTNETVLSAFRMAVTNRKPSKAMIFHSDRGVQYACSAFANTIDAYDIRRSMSRKGNCWDNAVAESFFKTLKCELVYGNKLKSKNEMRKEIFEYIELWYNKTRRHSALGNLSIEEFWKQLNNANSNLNIAA